MTKMKVGLVLSGGGAIGAYQVGMVRALCELGVEVHSVSGASIGALNGAILASAPSLLEGTHRLESLWCQLAINSPLDINKSVYLKLLLATGLKFNYASKLLPVINAVKKVAAPYISSLKHIPTDITSDGLLSDKPLTDLMEKYLDLDGLKCGLPFYVSVYKSKGGILDILSCVSAELGITDTSPSEFIHIQNLPQSEQKEVLLASAALPLLFKPKTIGKNSYSDGGMGGWSKSHGNTPIQPLIDAGCNMVIVSHLCDGSLWSRHDFPDTTILEIRPQSSLSRNTGIFGGAKDLLGFTPENINSWISQGYEDTRKTVSHIMKPVLSRQSLNQSESCLQASMDKNQLADDNLADAMKLIS